MNTFTNLSFGDIFAFSLVLQKLVKHSLKSIYQSDFFKEFFKLIDSHHGNGHNFFRVGWKSCLICEIFGVVHFKEAWVEFIEFVWYVPETEYEDLIMIPYLIEWGHEGMRIFWDFIEWSELGLDVVINEILNVLPHVFVDFHLVLRVRFELWDPVDMSESMNIYALISEWLVTMVELSLINL